MSFDETLARSLELLRDARRGDLSALERVAALCGPRLLDRIRLMMGDRARLQAESGDFLHETLVHAARSVDGFELRSEGQLLRWLTEIARNRIRDAVRRSRERALTQLSDSVDLDRRLPGKEPSPSSEAAGRDALHALAEALESLRPDERAAVELRHFEGLSFRALGERLGRSENAAQLLHARALLRLSKKLGR